MAIVVEDQQKEGGGGSVLGLAVWLLVLGLVGAGVYYIAFAKPEFVEVVAPIGFKATEEIAKLNLNADEILADPRFEDLRTHVTLTPTGMFGRENPFLVEGPAPARPAGGTIRR